MEPFEMLGSTSPVHVSLDTHEYQWQPVTEVVNTALNISTASDDSYYSFDNSEQNVCSGFDLPKSTASHQSSVLPTSVPEQQQLKSASSQLVNTSSLE